MNLACDVWWWKLEEIYHVEDPDVYRWIILKWIMIYFLIAIALTPGDRSTVHIYIQTIYRTTQ